MSEKQYEVPEGLLRIATEGVKDLWDSRPAAWNPSEDKASIAKAAVLAFVEAISENPLVPTREQLQSIADENGRGRCYPESIDPYVIGFQRRCWLKPETEVPETVKDLLWSQNFYAGDVNFADAIPKINKNVIEAERRGFERGLKAGNPK